MSKSSTAPVRSADARFVRYAIVTLVVIAAFFASYRIAVAARGTASAASGVEYLASGTGAGAATPAGSGGAACACCGTSGQSTPVEGSATQDADGVQRITVDTSSGSYNPNTIKLAAGVPAEITFTAASGCLGQVMSEDLGFFEDLTTGDKTVRLDGLAAGTYEFSCGMQMVFGSIVVE